jgi:hypothetical protein
MSYLSQELAIREDFIEEKLKSLIDQKPKTLKTEDQAPDADSAPASDEEEFKSIRQPLRTAVQDDPDDPDDEDPSSSTDEEKTSRPKRASGRGDRRKQARGRRRRKMSILDRDCSNTQRRFRSSKEGMMKAFLFS